MLIGVLAQLFYHDWQSGAGGREKYHNEDTEDTEGRRGRRM
jgi:hypothetical protein